MPGQRIIFDFGANNGDDVAYYLLKAHQVVAIEANPILADHIRSRFADAVTAGRLAVESAAVTVEAAADSVPFYVHRKNHVLSQFPAPDPEFMDRYERILVPSVNAAELIRKYGDPYYVKIDIEYYDAAILRGLFEAGIFPPYISAESHSIDIFALLLALGEYKAFKLVDGRSVAQRYRNARVRTLEGETRRDFPEHSAGPFGEDIDGPWMTQNNFFELLSAVRLGWRDIHASRLDAPDPGHAPKRRLLSWSRIKG